MDKWKYCVFLLIGMLGWSGVAGAQQRQPDYVVVEITWTDPATRQEQTTRGQLWFADDRFPVQSLNQHGVLVEHRWNPNLLAPREPGDIYIKRLDKEHGGRPLFHFKGYRATADFVFPYKEIPIVAQGDSLLAMMRSSVDDAGEMTAVAELFVDDDDDDDEVVDLLGVGDQRRANVVRLAMPGRSDLRAIPTDAIARIVLLESPPGFRFESYTGRYVQYSNAGRGDEGRVQVAAATFFGGGGEERFDAGAFMNDGSIVMVATMGNLDFLTGIRPRVIGRDQGVDEIPRNYRRTPVIVRYSPDLRRILEVVRLPWGAGVASSIFFGEDDALFMTLQPGPAFPQFFEGLRNKHTSGLATGRSPHTFLLRISPDRSRIDWAIKFQNVVITLTPYIEEQLLVRYGPHSNIVDPVRGSLRDGPVVQGLGGTTHDRVVHPRTGAFYLGGEYHSGTGLEPWRNPWLRKYNPDGTIAWTAYDWTGPVVGVENLRLVSDSVVFGVQVGADGNLVLRGWSDGGNSVFTRQPYDLRKGVPMGGWCASIWGAGVLSVPYLIRMDAETQEVYGVTRYNSYLPTRNEPNSISIRDFTTTGNGDVVVVGGSAFAFVETWDAWIEPWIKQYRTNEFASAKGGTFLTVFAPDMRSARLATILPGVRNPNLIAHGQWVLLYGAATERYSSYGHSFDTITKNAVQPEFGGGSQDAYVMLINTAGEPNPPELPAWTWGDRAGRR